MSEEDYIRLDDEDGAGATSSVPKDKKERVNTTLFISSLPYTATSTDLLTHFSFIGPVRHGFVATDKISGKSKGVGYITYSLKEDAERALAELDNGVFGGKGRKIRVKWADHRASTKDRNLKVAAAAEKAATAGAIHTSDDAAAPSDPNAIRTLVLSGLPSDLTKNVLWKKIRKVNENAEVTYPVEGESEDTAHIVFPSHGDALRALPKLHGHTYKGSLLSCVLKKRLEKLSSRGEGKSQSHAGRLIIRNLSWDTTVHDLRATFLPFGPIHSIDLPTLPSKLPPSADPSKPPPPPRARGFAFVWFLTKKDAENAIQGVNGKSIKTAGGKGEERQVAVDWALSKDKWQEANKTEGGDKVEKENDESGSGEEESSEDESSEDSNEDDVEGSGDEDAEQEDEDDEEEEEEEEEPVKPQLPSVDVGSTLFIRNLPFETTEQELNELFRSFGPLRYARITMDKFTGRSRGSGFVCFWKTEHADQAIEEAERVASETGANAMPLGGSKNPFALPSVLTVDPSSSLASRLVLHGRTLEVTRAVTREQAGQMKEDGERARNAGDKRNTYLMREGVIFPNSPAAASLPEAEVEKRQASFNSRKTLLRSNPSLYISKTRLSIRQLPLFATDRTLKRLAIHAIRSFDSEVKAGEREALARTEELDETLSAALEARKDKRKAKGKERETAVIQSKVVRQTEKIDPLTNQGRSKGYGFLELKSHKDALKVLRWANNNAEVGKLMWEWWKVELGEIRERAVKSLEARRKGEKSTTTTKEGESDDEEVEVKKPEAKVVKGKEEKVVESIEDLESRLKKLDARLAEGDDRSQGGMRGGKTLLIEFSIENIQVVKRRVEKITTSRENATSSTMTARDGKRKHSDQIEAQDTDDEGDSGEKSKRGKFGKDDKKDKGGKRDKKGRQRGEKDKREKRVSVEEKKVEIKENEKRGLEKMGDKLGNMIGRKRRERRGK